MTPNQISREVITAATKVHTALGPGLLEKAYERCLAYELSSAGLIVAQVPLPVVYKQVRLDFGYRLDLLINDLVVVEIKAIDMLAPIHKAQLLSYLRMSGKPLGLLINFNVVHLRDGIKRVVGNLSDLASSASLASSALQALVKD
ncbi:MAG: GxxExxY protein [Terriglobales bacterium]